MHLFDTGSLGLLISPLLFSRLSGQQIKFICGRSVTLFAMSLSSELRLVCQYCSAMNCVLLLLTVILILVHCEVKLLANILLVKITCMCSFTEICSQVMMTDELILQVFIRCVPVCLSADVYQVCVCLQVFIRRVSVCLSTGVYQVCVCLQVFIRCISVYRCLSGVCLCVCLQVFIRCVSVCRCLSGVCLSAGVYQVCVCLQVFIRCVSVYRCLSGVSVCVYRCSTFLSMSEADPSFSCSEPDIDVLDVVEKSESGQCEVALHYSTVFGDDDDDDVDDNEDDEDSVNNVSCCTVYQVTMFGRVPWLSSTE